MHTGQIGDQGGVDAHEDRRGLGEHLAAGGPFETGDDAKQSALARAVLPHNADLLAGSGDERDATEARTTTWARAA